MEAIKIITTKNGKRKAYRFLVKIGRSIPIAVNEAEALIASGKAELVDRFFYE